MLTRWKEDSTNSAAKQNYNQELSHFVRKSRRQMLNLIYFSVLTNTEDFLGHFQRLSNSFIFVFYCVCSVFGLDIEHFHMYLTACLPGDSTLTYANMSQR